MIPDGAVVSANGFVMAAVADELCLSLIHIYTTPKGLCQEKRVKIRPNNPFSTFCQRRLIELVQRKRIPR